MLYPAFYHLSILLFSAAAQWTQSTNPYLNQPMTSSSTSNIAGYLASSAANAIDSGVTSPEYTRNSWSTTDAGPATSISRTYEETTPDSSSAEDTYPTSEKTYTETTKGPHTETATSSTTENSQWPTDSTTVSANSENSADEKPKKIVEAKLLESIPINTPTASQSQADVPGSESKTALPGEPFQKHIVDEINKYRVMHGAAPVRVNTDLTTEAIAWAQKMARDDGESLDINSKYGQLTFSGVNPIPNDGVASVRHWYNRIKNYAWDNPKVSTKSMQFTQLVWSASQQVGVGHATSATGKSYVAALFSPPGNKQKELVQNVLPVTGSGAGKLGSDFCPHGWHKFKKSCYRYFDNKVKWPEAANLCDDEHSSLASLESIEEETSVRSLLATDEGAEGWVGLSDRVNPDSKNLIWVDGNPMPYSNWNAYQDDVTEGQKCATLSIATKGWMYRSCKETFGFICKKRLKDIMTYLVDMIYPEKLWSDNLRSEASPRYMAMKRHLDHAIMNLYNDDDWFVDMLFEGFSPSPEDKVTAEFKLRFSPDGDAPSDPLEKLRTKLESSGLIDGQNLMLTNVSLQNEDPDSCPNGCLTASDACKSPHCPIYCCRTFPTRRKSSIPPSITNFQEKTSYGTNQLPLKRLPVITSTLGAAGRQILRPMYTFKQGDMVSNNGITPMATSMVQGVNYNPQGYRQRIGPKNLMFQYQQLQQEMNRFDQEFFNRPHPLQQLQLQLQEQLRQRQQQQQEQQQQQLRQRLLDYQNMNYLKQRPPLQQPQNLQLQQQQQQQQHVLWQPRLNYQNIDYLQQKPKLQSQQQQQSYQPLMFYPQVNTFPNTVQTIDLKNLPTRFQSATLNNLQLKGNIIDSYQNGFHFRHSQCRAPCPAVCAPSCIHGCCRSKREES